jgi:hypothetical protein
MKKIIPVLALALFIVSQQSCKKSTETYNGPAIEEYAPLITGKYISYNLDSLVFLPFGGSYVIRSYQVKYAVDAPITDNAGNEGYRIVRYIKNTPSSAWAPDATFSAFDKGHSFEFTENNLKYIKLKLPVRDGFSWRGNSYIDTYSLNSEVKYLDGWDYTYEGVGQPKTVGTFNLDNTLMVNQREDSLGAPVTPLTQYAEKNISKEIYAKNIGMVYREFLHWEFQRVTNSYTGYGVTLTMIDHN